MGAIGMALEILLGDFVEGLVPLIPLSKKVSHPHQSLWRQRNHRFSRMKRPPKQVHAIMRGTPVKTGEDVSDYLLPVG